MAKQKRGPVWGYSTSEEPGHWDGECESFADAVDEGRDEYEGEPFYVVSGRWLDPAWFFDVDHWIENVVQECVYDNAPEDAELEVTTESVGKLKELVAKWCAKHVSISCWEADGTPVRIETPNPRANGEAER